jgi:hypothetical protein
VRRYLLVARSACAIKAHSPRRGHHAISAALRSEKEESRLATLHALGSWYTDGLIGSIRSTGPTGPSGSAAGGARPSRSRSRNRSRRSSSSSSSSGGGGGGGGGSGNTQQARQQQRTRRRGVATPPFTRPRFAERGGGARVWLLVETAWHRSRKRACHPGPGTCV